MASAAPSMEQIKGAMRTTWMAGDFGVIAKNSVKGAEEFIARLDIPAGAKVLDVACGTGNLAIPLAQRGCVVTGVDIAPNLLEQARERAAEEGLAATFDEGDAERLPYADASFDAVVSMFGAMFAPRPDIVVSELARVLKPRGTLAMANWTPGGFSGKMFKTGSKHMPPPPGVPPPVLWGDDATVRERLGKDFINIKTEPTPLTFDYKMSPTDVVAMFRKYFGPTQVAFSRLDEAGQKAYQEDLVALWSGANTADDPANQIFLENEYLKVTAQRA